MSKHLAYAFFASVLLVGSARGQRIVGISQDFVGGGIQTYDFGNGGTLVNFLTPTGAGRSIGRGFGVEVVGNKIFYTGEVGFLITDVIHVAGYNGGDVLVDTGTLPNPRSDSLIVDLAYAKGLLYVLTLKQPPDDRLFVYGLNPLTGAVVSGPVDVGFGPTAVVNGFTVLPNGNFLIGESCDYHQHDPTTGAQIAGASFNLAFSNPGFLTACTGVDTDGTFLYFATHAQGDPGLGFAPGLIKTDLAGGFLSRVPRIDFPPEVPIQDIAIPKVPFAGTPGAPNCQGVSISALARQYGGVNNAARSLGYPSVDALQSAIASFCGN